MDSGSELWLVLSVVLPLLAIVAVLLSRRGAMVGKGVRLAVMITAIALLAIYTIWSLFFRH